MRRRSNAHALQTGCPKKNFTLTYLKSTDDCKQLIPKSDSFRGILQQRIYKDKTILGQCQETANFPTGTSGGGQRVLTRSDGKGRVKTRPTPQKTCYFAI